jgi:hypothetical protein
MPVIGIVTCQILELEIVRWTPLSRRKTHFLSFGDLGSAGLSAFSEAPCARETLAGNERETPARGAVHEPLLLLQRSPLQPG